MHHDANGWPCAGKYLGLIEDRQVTPFIRMTFYEKYKFIIFPCVRDNDYQKRRFYSDEIILSEYEFNKLTKDNFKEILNETSSQ